jgi:two-component system phosphate regulon sensor histidine kinase PhoR
MRDFQETRVARSGPTLKGLTPAAVLATVVERPMINWRPELPLGGQAEAGIDVNGRNGFAQADSDFSATLLAMAGHDLRQPLQVITSAHDVLGQILRGDKQREELARAADAAARLGSMLSQLVGALQLRERSGNHLHVPVRLRPLLEDLASEFAEPARLKGIELRVIPASVAVFSHPVLLSGILGNLIRNAIDYTPRGGRVCVACRRRGSQAHLEIRDSGVGIPADELAQVIWAFHRTDATCSEGLGLGLFIVKRAANLLGHRVEVASAAGRGSCFAVVANAAPTNGGAP